MLPLQREKQAAGAAASAVKLSIFVSCSDGPLPENVQDRTRVYAPAYPAVNRPAESTYMVASQDTWLFFLLVASPSPQKHPQGKPPPREGTKYVSAMGLGQTEYPHDAEYLDYSRQSLYSRYGVPCSVTRLNARNVRLEHATE